MSTTTLPRYRDTPVDVRVRLSTLWTAMIFVFAYVDIVGFFRAGVLEAALDGTVGTTGLTVDQTFLTLTLVYITLSTLMVVLSLVLRPRANRVANLVMSPLYLISIGVSCVGGSTTSWAAPSRWSCSGDRLDGLDLAGLDHVLARRCASGRA